MAKGKKQGTRKTKHDEYRTDLLERADMVNERFESYYKAQKLVPDEEWEALVGSLKRHLPTTFRVAGSRQTANTLNSTITNVHVPALSDVTFEDQLIPPPVQIPWYPDGFAWQFNVPKKVLRKSPEFKKFHSFLVFETEVGNISRQEAVSMLPPLFLDVEPHHIVLDMCAAPGSKTAQLLEALHTQDSRTSTSIPSGLLIANDNDNKRTHLLIHQSSRVPSPAFMVTNLDASIYPIIKIPAPKNENKTGLKQLLFDRILCDVPCSGDGTMRKNIGIWKTWQPMDGNGLHSLQVRILQRAMKLLKEDGRIVYSTCSLNPVENEAVIAEALNSNPEFHLADVSSRFAELQRRPGLTSWRPSVDRSVNTSYATFQEYVRSDDGKGNTKLTEGHWPPVDVEKYNLPRCMRIYPHLQDTGGFFVAVLERMTLSTITRKREADELPKLPESKKPRLVQESEMSSDDASKTPDVPEESIGSAKGVQLVDARTGNSFKEHPYTFLSPDDPVLSSCIEKLSLKNGFPSSNILVRNPAGEPARSLYLANDLVKGVIENNDYTRIRLTAAGTKVFVKQEGGRGSEPQFRVLGEGLPVILPFVDPTTIDNGDFRTLKVLIQAYYPVLSSFEEPFKGVAEAWAAGSHLVRFPPGELEGAVLSHEVIFPIWKSNVSLTLMMDKQAKSALSVRLFGQDISTAGREAAEKLARASGTSSDILNEGISSAIVFQEGELVKAMGE